MNTWKINGLLLDLTLLTTAICGYSPHTRLALVCLGPGQVGQGLGTDFLCFLRATTMEFPLWQGEDQCPPMESKARFILSPIAAETDPSKVVKLVQGSGCRTLGLCQPHNSHSL